MASSLIGRRSCSPRCLAAIGLPGSGFAFGHGSTNGIGVPRIDVAGSGDRFAAKSGALNDSGGPHRRYAARPRRRVTTSMAVDTPIPTSNWSTGRAAIRSTIIRTSTGCGAPGRSRETVIVHDSWWTATARHADIVLPATTPLERNDVGGSSRDSFVLAMHPRHRPRRRGPKRLRHFPRAGARASVTRTAFTERPRRDGLVPMGLRSRARKRDGKGSRAARFPAILGRRVVELPPPDARPCAVRGFPPRSGRCPLKTPPGSIEIVSERSPASAMLIVRRIRRGFRRRSGSGSPAAAHGRFIS